MLYFIFYIYSIYRIYVCIMYILSSVKRERETHTQRDRETLVSPFFILQVKRLMGYAVGVPMGLVHIHVLKYCQHTR